MLHPVIQKCLHPGWKYRLMHAQNLGLSAQVSNVWTLLCVLLPRSALEYRLRVWSHMPAHTPQGLKALLAWCSSSNTCCHGGQDPTVFCDAH